MKKTNVFLPALCMAALFCSCSGGSDSGDDLLASPLKVIENIDIDLTSESLSRSAQVARTVSPSDEGGAASPVMALSAPGVRLMAADGQIAVLAEEYDPDKGIGRKDESSTIERARGDYAAAVQILDIVKKEIAAEVRSRNLPFGQAMSNLSITATRIFEKKENTGTVTVNYFRVDLVGLSAYLYSYGTVADSNGKNDYNFVLKCVPNIMGLSLDTELYMVLGSGSSSSASYSRITTSRNKKVRLEYGTQFSKSGKLEDFWSEYNVEPSRITVYRYNKSDSAERTASLVIGNYFASAYRRDGDKEDGAQLSQADGTGIGNKGGDGNWNFAGASYSDLPSALSMSAVIAELDKHPYASSTPPSVSSIPSDLTSRLTSR